MISFLVDEEQNNELFYQGVWIQLLRYGKNILFFLLEHYKFNNSKTFVNIKIVGYLKILLRI